MDGVNAFATAADAGLAEGSGLARFDDAVYVAALTGSTRFRRRRHELRSRWGSGAEARLKPVRADRFDSATLDRRRLRRLGDWLAFRCGLRSTLRHTRAVFGSGARGRLGNCRFFLVRRLHWRHDFSPSNWLVTCRNSWISMGLYRMPTPIASAWSAVSSVA